MSRCQRVRLRDVVVVREQADWHVDSVVVGGGEYCVAVFGGDSANGVGGVVDGGEHCDGVIRGVRQACGVAGRTGVSCCWCPLWVVVGDASGLQD